MLQLAVTANVALIDGLAFDPFFRGLLSVLVSIVVLCGSIYLIVATNTGSRSGFLISLASLFGWMFLMGIVWTIYGIGWRGTAPTWALVEINVDDAADIDDGLLYSEVLEAAELAPSDDGIPEGGLAAAPFDSDAVAERFATGDEVDDLASELDSVASIGDIADQDLAQEAALVTSRELDIEDWIYLEASDPIRGEAQASVDAFLVENGVFAAGEYVPEQFGAFLIPGKPPMKEDANPIDRVVHTLDETILHPSYDEEYIVVQVRATIQQPTLPGQPPPVATVDPEAPLVSVLMERDRGGPFPSLFSGLRFKPAMFSLFCGLLFAMLAWNLHVRDLREASVRAAA